ncbi:hypothetical protein PS925_02141 [Pseudomonas fluorescens]|uniref:Uncharacterized protein n=1 Tax=Pseudomonas fluorescens TaxID=294 RepID=A0A5E7TM15_PSEFL|nr:hypothetical protein [Pseudomonas fluorescens]VVP99280.1 hypothetical protein PS925_02141 [Pseudomonas fluorescens]
MFNYYLNSKSCYLRLEQDFYDFFYLEALKKQIDFKIFKVPYYNTFFSNGTPLMDGNPIFSARNELSGQILRVVLDEGAEKLSFYYDKDAGCELVIFGRLSFMDKIKTKISAWVLAQ